MDSMGSLSAFAVDGFLSAKLPPGDVQLISIVLCSVLRERSAWATLKALC